MSKNSDELSMSAALQMAQSKEGQQIFQALKSQNSDAINEAMNHLAAGNQDQAKSALSALLRSPQVKAMLEQLRRNQNG